MAGLGAAALFLLGLLAHEASHAAVARRNGIEVDSITLWLFGGVAPAARQGGRAGSRAEGGRRGSLGEPAARCRVRAPRGGSRRRRPHGSPGRRMRLAGRSQRAAGGVQRDSGCPAGRWPGAAGSAVALAWRPVVGDGHRGPGGPDAGNPPRRRRPLRVPADRGISLLWLGFIGWFLAGAATAEEQQALLEDRLTSVRVGDVMSPHPDTAPADITVQQLIDEHLFQQRHSTFPLLAGGHLVGLVTLRRVKAVPAGRRALTTAREIACPIDQVPVTTAQTPLPELIPRLNASPDGRALVLEDGRLVGVFSPTDVSRAVEHGSLRSEPRSSAPGTRTRGGPQGGGCMLEVRVPQERSSHEPVVHDAEGQGRSGRGACMVAALATTPATASGGRRPRRGGRSSRQRDWTTPASWPSPATAPSTSWRRARAAARRASPTRRTRRPDAASKPAAR